MRFMQIEMVVALCEKCAFITNYLSYLNLCNRSHPTALYEYVGNFPAAAVLRARLIKLNFSHSISAPPFLHCSESGMVEEE